MINGKVNSQLEAKVSVVVHDVSGTKRTLEALIDTGFSGFLTLPQETISSLGLQQTGSTRMILADGRIVSCAVYRVVVDWDGIPVDIEVEDSNFTPLVGAALLDGFRLNVEMENGGQVVIEPLNSPHGSATG